MSLHSRGYGRGMQAVVASLVLAAGATSALGQATQGGRALERDLRVGVPSTGLTPRASMRDEVNFRNALITGNVGGGRSFRGSVGYTAPDEFRGRLSSDNLFSFRRDSASAGQVRAGASIRSQFSLSTGLSQGINQRFGGGTDQYSRDGASGLAAARVRPGAAGDVRPGGGLDQLRTGALRSTAAYVASEGLDQATVGYTRTELGLQRVTASGLLGVRSRALETPGVSPAVRRAQEQQAATRDAELRPGQVPSLQQNLAQPEGNESLVQSEVGVQGGRTRTLYDELRERLDAEPTTERRTGAAREGGREGREGGREGGEGDRLSGARALPVVPSGVTGGAGASGGAGSAPSGTGSGTGQAPSGSAVPSANEGAPEGGIRSSQTLLDELRERLVSPELRMGEGRDWTAGTGRSRDGERDGGTQRDGAGTDAEGMEGEDGAEEEVRPGIDEETLEMILRAGGRANRFIDPVTGKRDVYAEHMETGQELLAQQRYFDAEERFAGALLTRPGDVTAMTARLHAQIGAGLNLSAALNLRTLLTQHPEVTGLRYTGSTIPSEARLRSAIAELRGKIRRARDSRELPLAGDGLLMAYIAWQVGDRAAVEEGLELARTGASPQGVGGADGLGENPALLELTRRVWLREETPPPQGGSGTTP